MIANLKTTEELTMTKKEFDLIKYFCITLQEYYDEVDEFGDSRLTILDILSSRFRDDEEKITELAKMDYCIKVEEEEKNEEN